LKLDEFSKNDDSDLFKHLNRYLLSRIEEHDSIDPRKSILLKTINQTKGTS